MRVRGSGLAMALAIVAGCAAARAPEALPRDAARWPLILTFWCGPPLAELDDARSAEIAAAGFTVIGAPCQGDIDPAQTLHALDVAQRHDLHMWVLDHRISPEAVAAADWPAPLDAAVTGYSRHPALGGYVVADEPTVPQFESVGAVVSALRAGDPGRLAYVNLLPDYIPATALGAASYEDYIEQFIGTVRPQLLSYDYYPFGHEK